MMRIGEKTRVSQYLSCNIGPLLHLFTSHWLLCYGLRQDSLTNQLEALAYILNCHWALVQTGDEQQLVFSKTLILSFECLTDVCPGEKLEFVRPAGSIVCLQFVFVEIQWMLSDNPELVSLTLQFQVSWHSKPTASHTGSCLCITRPKWLAVENMACSPHTRYNTLLMFSWLHISPIALRKHQWLYVHTSVPNSYSKGLYIMFICSYDITVWCMYSCDVLIRSLKRYSIWLGDARSHHTKWCDSTAMHQGLGCYQTSHTIATTIWSSSPTCTAKSTSTGTMLSSCRQAIQRLRCHHACERRACHAWTFCKSFAGQQHSRRRN